MAESKTKLPRALKAKLMLWTDVSYHDMELIDQMQSIPDIESALCRVFSVDLPQPKRGVLLELYIQTVLFCRTHGLKKEQTSTLLSIIKSIHEANVETPLNNIDQCLKYSQELLLCHSVRRPPFSINIFNFEEANCILKYINNYYLQLYKLYKYVFTPQVTLDVSLTYSGSSASEETSEADESVQETSITEEENSQGSVDLKALIERQVREEMKLVSGQLEERIRALFLERSGTPSAPQPGHRGKK